MKYLAVISALLLLWSPMVAQDSEPDELPKVLHAEPIYIDLIRDLGARKGEREWNFGFGLTDFRAYDEYELLVEYEFAAWDRIGMEFELPAQIYSSDTGSAPSSGFESIKTAIQWTFLVDEKRNISLAAGYLNELLITPFEDGPSPLFKGNLFNPIFIGAKRLGEFWHSLIYTGPRLEYTFDDQSWHNEFEMHLNIHYMVPGTSNFAGLEVNQYFGNDSYDITLRPQLRVDINDNLLVGMVTGIPLNTSKEKLSFFVRLIYEPEFHL